MPAEVVLWLIQKMFRAEDIASDEEQQQNHVYNLLVVLKALSRDKQRHRHVNSSTRLSTESGSPVLHTRVSTRAVTLQSLDSQQRW